MLVGGPAEAGDAYRRQLGPHADKLIVLPGRTPEQVVALTRRADVLVHPRLACRENYSVQSKLAVYLASGRPIVATDFGDYRPSSRHHRCRPPHGRRSRRRSPRGILDVLTDPSLAARLAASAGPVAEEFFGMDRNIDRYLDVYAAPFSPAPRRDRSRLSSGDRFGARAGPDRYALTVPIPERRPTSCGRARQDMVIIGRSTSWP